MARQRSTPASPEASVDVQRAVLDGALDIIATEGAEAVSMREVARRAGVSHQAPYHYFGDRAGIFAAISEEGFRRFTEEFRSALDVPGNIAANCLRAYVLFAVHHKGFRYLWHTNTRKYRKCCKRSISSPPRLS